MHINYSVQGRPLSSNLGRFTALKPALAPSTPQQSQQGQSQSQQSQQALPGDPGSAASALSPADLAEMLTLLHKLGAQVDELTMRVAGQSEN
jgi:hypothetical protein